MRVTALSMGFLFAGAVSSRTVGGQEAVASDPSEQDSLGPPRYELALIVERDARGPVDTTDGGDWAYRVSGAGISLGRYWSDHHRTELSMVATTRAQTQATYFVGRTVYGAFVSHDYRHELISLAHVFQFLRNRWVHPQIGLGATLDVEHRRSWLEVINPEFADGAQFPTEADRQRALAAHPTRTQAAIRPFGLAAVKVYVSPRAFLRAAVHVSPFGDPNRWTLRASVGRDW
jgi:hypothetical protein